MRVLFVTARVPSRLQDAIQERRGALVTVSGEQPISWLDQFNEGDRDES